MKTYRGSRLEAGYGITSVMVSSPNGSYPLALRWNEMKHSEAFEWGYNGSGPGQLAYAILRTIVGKEKTARWYHEFKLEIISQLPHGGFTLEEKLVRDWLARHVILGS